MPRRPHNVVFGGFFAFRECENSGSREIFRLRVGIVAALNCRLLNALLPGIVESFVFQINPCFSAEESTDLDLCGVEEDTHSLDELLSNEQLRNTPCLSRETRPIESISFDYLHSSLARCWDIL